MKKVKTADEQQRYEEILNDILTAMKKPYSGPSEDDMFAGKEYWLDDHTKLTDALAKELPFEEIATETGNTIVTEAKKIGLKTGWSGNPNHCIRVNYQN